MSRRRPCGCGATTASPRLRVRELALNQDLRSAAQATRGRLPRGMRASQLLVLLFVGVIGFFVLYPLVMLLIGSFVPPRGAPADVWFSLDGYRTALTDTAARGAIPTTPWLSPRRAGLPGLGARV